MYAYGSSYNGGRLGPLPGDDRAAGASAAPSSENAGPTLTLGEPDSAPKIKAHHNEHAKVAAPEPVKVTTPAKPDVVKPVDPDPDKGKVTVIDPKKVDGGVTDGGNQVTDGTVDPGGDHTTTDGITDNTHDTSDGSHTTGPVGEQPKPGPDQPTTVQTPANQQLQ